MAALVWPIILLYFLVDFSCAIPPRAIEWSSKVYGPDGPWQAVSISIGTPGQNIDLYPGGFFNSVIYASSLCATVCDAQVAGLYDPSASSTQFSFPEVPTLTNSFSSGTGGVNASFIFDNLNVLSTGSDPPAVVSSFDMQVLTAGFNVLPNGVKYPLEIGNLAFGARDVNQTWQRAGQPDINGTMLPSGLFAAGLVPSNSYGLHIGSVALSIPASLYIGGYDQTRVLGQVTTQPYGLNFLPIDLLDIGIGVAVGDSPFDFSSRGGLLAKGNSTIGSALQVHVDSVPPYLYLPQSTCDALALNLPVTFSPDYNIYFWNTSDPLYEKIISSPSYLGFTFRLNNSISQNMTINVPFSLLNLTLTAPLVSEPTQYFPCSPVTDSSPYMLGKAFLQAAFVGVTWQTNDDGVWFLAQAPGPNTPTPSLGVVTTIAPADKFIVASENSWIDTWSHTWTPIGTNTINIPTAGTTTLASSTGVSSNTSVGHGISNGAIAGVAVGTISILVALGLGCYFTRMKIRSRVNGSSSMQRSGVGASSLSQGSELEDKWAADYGRWKTDGTTTKDAIELHNFYKRSRLSYPMARSGQFELEG
ncbi:hypothetical protein BP6252_07322 [Coleophoma cylindrospora]|uniref:Peptidase A1 domain-containing protein n=1 Tax=Coleophoma cylindrospora TaxID=1849047 RepID=A0A3D8RH86_9HELO|nr:hypothetical protein BP6252_07322 [Coleophoma cylindrospora]